MSHYTVVKNTKINDLAILKRTLSKLGYTTKDNYFIRGHEGSRQVDLAVKIDGKYCVGFHKSKDDSYHVISDWSYSNTSSKKYMSEVKQIYNTEKIIHEAQSKGYSLIQQKVVNGGIRLVLRKVA